MKWIINNISSQNHMIQTKYFLWMLINFKKSNRNNQIRFKIIIQQIWIKMVNMKMITLNKILKLKTLMVNSHLENKRLKMINITKLIHQFNITMKMKILKYFVYLHLNFKLKNVYIINSWAKEVKWGCHIKEVFQIKINLMSKN